MLQSLKSGLNVGANVCQSPCAWRGRTTSPNRPGEKRYASDQSSTTTIISTVKIIQWPRPLIPTSECGISVQIVSQLRKFQISASSNLNWTPNTAKRLQPETPLWLNLLGILIWVKLFPKFRHSDTSRASLPSWSSQPQTKNIKQGRN